MALRDAIWKWEFIDVHGFDDFQLFYLNKHQDRLKMDLICEQTKSKDIIWIG